jgi:hypothetical protein
LRAPPRHTIAIVCLRLTLPALACPPSQSLFEKTVNAAFEDGSAPLVDGYAPFCKHVFVPNFTPAKVSALAISKENEALLRSAYEARTEQELPVLARWFPKEAVGEPPVAKFLDVILYSREQIRKEATAMGRPEELEEDAPWGIISVKPQARSSADFRPACTRHQNLSLLAAATPRPQDVDYELPMQPITMMRNTMVEEGGSGVPLEREKYIASVEFWAGHALIK